MANGFKGEVALTYAGQDYVLVLDFNALCDFEGETKKDALTVLEGMDAGKASVTDLRALMWAGLRQRHPDMTLQLAGSIFSENVDAIQRAVTLVQPKPAAGPKRGNAQRPAKARA